MKRLLRKRIKEIKAEYSADELERMSADVIGNLLNDADLQRGKTIVAYYSLPDEVDTRMLIHTLVQQGKTVLLPTVVGDDIVLRHYEGSHSLRIGQYGISEPQGKVFCDYDNIDVVIVPGIAFDSDGHRLGRGKGYYDRFLPTVKSAVKIGICFPFQFLENIPFEQHDAAMTKVVHG